MTLTLAECQQMARERQPRLATQRASLASAEDGKRALDNLRLPGKLDPQVPIRRRQASVGLAAAVAAVDKAEREVAYAVTRAYFTVLYAREQEKVAKGVVERLNATLEAAQQAPDAGAREASATDIKKTTVYLRLAETRRTQATQGVKRALIALREAMGLGTEFVLDIPGDRLPEPSATPSKDDIVALALSRRAELIQVRVFAQVACLEIDAQATSHSQRMQTFAAGTDIHAQQVPDESHGDNYRPGAFPPEMPTILVGSRGERMTHARTLATRAETLVETTRNLITLEAEDAFLRWEEASTQVQQAKLAAEAGEKMADEIRKEFAAGLKTKVEDVVTSRVLASQARSEYYTFLHKQIVALADLERATAGGFSAALEAK